MSLSSIATAALRAAGLSEITFKKAVKKELTGNLTVVVYSEYTTEEEVPIDSNPIWVRARSIQEDQAHLTDPEDISDPTRQRKEILKSYVAYLDASSPFTGQLLNGRKWSATWDGGNTVKLIAPESGEPAMMLGMSGTSASSAFANNTKQPVLNERRVANGEIKLNASTSLQAQLDKFPHFRNFFNEFRKRLRTTNFSSTSIQVNSLYRDGAAQARAMVASRFKGDSASLAYFRQWYLNTYTNAKSDTKIYNTIFGTEWKDPKKLQSALAVIYQKRIDTGYYKNSTGHSTMKAIDMNTNKQTYDNVIIMLDVLGSMKKDGIVKYYNWEEVWDHKKGQREVGLSLRKTRGVFKPSEHIHLGLISGPTEGE